MSTDRPWGVPSTGEAVKPRKLTSSWNGLPCVSLTLTLPNPALSASATLSACPPCNCLPESVCTLPGTCSAGSALELIGVVPTTTSSGNSLLESTLPSAAGTRTAGSPASNSAAPVRPTLKCRRTPEPPRGTDTGSLALRNDGNSPRAIAHRNRRDDLELRGINDRYVVRRAIGCIEIRCIRTQRQAPRALSNGHRSKDFQTLRVEDHDMG